MSDHCAGCMMRAGGAARARSDGCTREKGEMQPQVCLEVGAEAVHARAGLLRRLTPRCTRPRRGHTQRPPQLTYHQHRVLRVVPAAEVRRRHGPRRPLGPQIRCKATRRWRLLSVMSSWTANSVQSDAPLEPSVASYASGPSSEASVVSHRMACNAPQRGPKRSLVGRDAV